jgi:hypothetical protein
MTTRLSPATTTAPEVNKMASPRIRRAQSAPQSPSPRRSSCLTPSTAIPTEEPAPPVHHKKSSSSPPRRSAHLTPSKATPTEETKDVANPDATITQGDQTELDVLPQLQLDVTPVTKAIALPRRLSLLELLPKRNCDSLEYQKLPSLRKRLLKQKKAHHQ